jgi:hypothetical protein
MMSYIIGKREGTSIEGLGLHLEEILENIRYPCLVREGWLKRI